MSSHNQTRFEGSQCRRQRCRESLACARPSGSDPAARASQTGPHPALTEKNHGPLAYAGLLSVLMISVSERLREIGVRKAVGAPDRAVFQQFLVESVTISAVGGLAGLSLGAALCKLISILATQAGQDITIPVSGTGLALGIGFAIAVGFLFGLYPAFKASRLDPIAAISRHA